MADLTPFTAWWGSRQGRIRPTGWTAPLGSFVLCLGDDLPGKTATLVDGDEVTVSQTLNLSTASFIVFVSRVRAPRSIPVGCVWTFHVACDGVDLLTVPILASDRVRDRADIGVCVAPNSTGQGGVASVLSFQLAFSAPSSTYEEAELPGVYIDAVAPIDEQTTNTPRLLNRAPEPNERQVPPDATIVVEIYDGGTSGVDVDATRIVVNGVPAVVAGVIQSGFDGARSGVTNVATTNPPTPTGVRYELDPSVPFDSSSAVFVDVSAALIAMPPLLNSYSFFVADSVSPVVVKALAVDQKRVDLTWAEAVLQVDGASAADALLGSNYTLRFVGTPPAVTPAVVGVTSLGGSVVELQLDVEMTPGALYEVAVANVTDIAGNVVVPPTNATRFAGYRPVPVPRRSFLVYDFFRGLLRDQDDGTLLKICEVLQEPIDILLERLDRFPESLDPDTATEAELDAMLYDLGNPFHFAITVLQKRQLLAILGAIYRSKGTDPGIIDAIHFFMGIEVSISVPSDLDRSVRLDVGTLGSDIDPGGTLRLGSSLVSDLYHFVVNVPVALTVDEDATMRAIIRYMMRGGTSFAIESPAPPPAVPDHAVLGVSRLDLNFFLHA